MKIDILCGQQDVVYGGDDLLGGEGPCFAAGTRRQRSLLAEAAGTGLQRTRLAEAAAFRPLGLHIEKGKRVRVVVGERKKRRRRRRGFGRSRYHWLRLH